MEALTPTTTPGAINVFLLGNNPIELSTIYSQLKAVKKNPFRTEIGFDSKDLFQRILKFKPSCLLIDDNIDKIYLKSLIKKLGTSAKTQNIAITVLKNSNYFEGNVEEAQEYVLKQSATPEQLLRSITNAIKLKRMQTYVYRNYKKGKFQLKEFFRN